MRKLTCLVLLVPGFASAVPYWACLSYAGKTHTKVLVFPGKTKTSAVFIFQKELEHDGEKIPGGMHEGILEPSTSGFSTFAKLNVEKYFPSVESDGSGVWFTLILPLRTKGNASDAYILWRNTAGEAEGILMGEYGCSQRKKGKAAFDW